jgi:hypothetical protein
VQHRERKLVDARSDVAAQQQAPSPPTHLRTPISHNAAHRLPAFPTPPPCPNPRPQKLESDHLKIARLRARLSRYYLERKQAQDKAMAAHAAALTDKTRIAAVVDRLHVLSKEHDR